MTMPDVHARLAPSSADRWLACPGSVALSESIEQRESSDNEYTREGTFAHAVAEHCIRLDIEPIGFIGEKLPDTERFPDPVSEEMATALQVYFEYVRDLAGEFWPDRIVEHQIRVDHLYPDGFGTMDWCVVIPFTRIHVVDLKYGRGVPVSAYRNPQERIYASGAYREFGRRWDVQDVETHIVQPRLDSITSEVITLDELAAFEDEVRAGVEAHTTHMDVFNSGDHCRWCPAVHVCPELSRKAQEVAALEFSAIPDESSAELLRLLGYAEAAAEQAKAIRDILYERACAGQDVPGHKLVATFGNRKWKDEDRAEQVLTAELGVPIFEKKLFSPAQVEAVAKKQHAGRTKLQIMQRKAVLDRINEFCIKPEGPATLVPESDRRPAIRVDAAADFD